MDSLFDNINEKNRINELVELINKYDIAYYSNAESLVSDYEYDMLLKELSDLEAKFPHLKREDSPTGRVSGEPLKEFKQITHNTQMLSLANTYTIGEVQDFFRRVAEGLEGEQFSISSELKYDGVAISIVYRDGKLSYAATRGNGFVGDDITQNVMTIKSIPFSVNEIAVGGIPLKNFEVRGEVYLRESDFVEINRNKEELGEKTYANPRNLTAGTIKMLDARAVAERPLQIACYHLISDDVKLESQSDNYEIMKKLGIPISPYAEKCSSIDDVVKFIEKWSVERYNLDFQIDGIVLKVDSIRQQDFLGTVARSPRWAIAYKYAPETAETVLNNIILQVGRTGAVTPVADLEPVFLAGSTISRATLHNYDFICEKDVRIGDYVIIEKGGEVIPKIVRPVLEKRKADSIPYVFPEECPCEHKTKLVRPEGEANYYCNSPDCPWQLRRRIEHFVSRDAMNIEGFGEKIVEMLVSLNLLNSISDIYKLNNHKDVLLNLDNWGAKKTENLLSAIEKSKEQPFANVLFALGIRFVGKTVSKTLVSNFKSIDKLISASIEELSATHEIGVKIAASVNDYFSKSYNIEMIDELRSFGLSFEAEYDDNSELNKKLTGLTFVFTGELSQMSRTKAAEIVETLGGKETKSVSKKTSYVVVGDNPGSKHQKALELKVNILNEEEFLKLIND